MKPYVFKNKEGFDVFCYEDCGIERTRVIPQKGMARYLYENGKLGDIQFMFINERKQKEQMNAIERDTYYLRTGRNYTSSNKILNETNKND